MSNIKKWSSFVGIQLLRTCMECTISSVLSKKGSLCDMLRYKANVATPPPMSSPILIVPGFFTLSTSSMEKSRPPPLPVHRVFSRPARYMLSRQQMNPRVSSINYQEEGTVQCILSVQPDGSGAEEVARIPGGEAFALEAHHPGRIR